MEPLVPHRTHAESRVLEGWRCCIDAPFVFSLIKSKPRAYSVPNIFDNESEETASQPEAATGRSNDAS
jgi:hypothetical protein